MALAVINPNFIFLDCTLIKLSFDQEKKDYNTTHVHQIMSKYFKWSLQKVPEKKTSSSVSLLLPSSVDTSNYIPLDCCKKTISLHVQLYSLQIETYVI